MTPKWEPHTKVAIKQICREGVFLWQIHVTFFGSRYRIAKQRIPAQLWKTQNKTNCSLKGEMENSLLKCQKKRTYQNLKKCLKKNCVWQMAVNVVVTKMVCHRICLQVRCEKCAWKKWKKKYYCQEIKKPAPQKKLSVKHGWWQLSAPRKRAAAFLYVPRSGVTWLCLYYFYHGNVLHNQGLQTQARKLIHFRPSNTFGRGASLRAWDRNPLKAGPGFHQLWFCKRSGLVTPEREFLFDFTREGEKTYKD